MSAMMEATPGLNSAERSEESGNHVEDDVLRRRASEEGRETTSEARAHEQNVFDLRWRRGARRCKPKWSGQI